MSVEQLSDALNGVVPAAHVEAQDRVAILKVDGPISLDAAARRRLVAMAREHGFSNIALELTPDANLSGDQPAR